MTTKIFTCSLQMLNEKKKNVYAFLINTVICWTTLKTENLLATVNDCTF